MLVNQGRDGTHLKRHDDKSQRERILDYCSKETRQDCHAVLIPLTVLATMACFTFRTT